MNKRVYFIFAGIIGAFWIGFLYDRFEDKLNPPKEEASTSTDKVKDGPVKTYGNDGKLKTLVNYRNGQKEGISYLYHRDGETVQLEMPYAEGKRQGTSKKYFENGDLYAATPYENNKLHGVRKTYYRNGNLKTAMPYGYGYPGIGLQEYLTDGSEKALPSLRYRQGGGRIQLSLSKPCEEIQYHIGTLIDGQFFDEFSDDLQLLPDRGTTSFVDLRVYTPSYLSYQDIICVCKTSQKNTLVLKTRIDTSSLKNVN